MFAGSSIGVAIDLLFAIAAIVVFGVPIVMVVFQVLWLVVTGIAIGIYRLFETLFR